MIQMTPFQIQGETMTPAAFLESANEALMEAIEFLTANSRQLDASTRQALHGEYQQLDNRRQNLLNVNSALAKINPMRFVETRALAKEAQAFCKRVHTLAHPLRNVDPLHWQEQFQLQEAPRAPAPVPLPENAPTPQSRDNGLTIRIGPIAFGEDIEGEIRGLIALLPEYEGTMAFTAQPEPGLCTYARVHFKAARDAVAFETAWTAQPPNRYEGVSVVYVYEPMP